VDLLEGSFFFVCVLLACCFGFGCSALVNFFGISL